MDSLIFTTQTKDKSTIINKNLSMNYSFMTASSSKIKQTPKILQPKFQQNISHVNCSCYHCQNNTKPLQTQFYPRIISQKQMNLQPNQAYTFILQHLVDFVGNLKIPDTFIAQDSSLAYKNIKNRIKIKPNLTPAQIKKNFDIRKVQYNKIYKNNQLNKIKISKLSLNKSSVININNNNTTNNNNNNNNLKVKNNNNISLSIKNNINHANQIDNKRDKQATMKQIALINYKNNFTQIVTESLLFKLLIKRKNDAFWQQISSISLLPPYKQKQILYHQYFYQRNNKTINQMSTVLQEISQAIDIQDNCDHNNPQNDLITQKIIQNKYQSNRIINNLKSYSLSKKNYPQNQNQYQKQLIENISKQIIAFLEVQHKIRILSASFQYIIDNQGSAYLVSINKFIIVHLNTKQLTFIHDRLKDLEQIGKQLLINKNQQISQTQTKYLMKQISQLMIDCLQSRKKQLKPNQIVYQRPSQQNLLLIFKKFFPNFNQLEVFMNKNWKNEFQISILKYRQNIQKMIRNDQGIRILKRYGITLYRTWDQSKYNI